MLDPSLCSLGRSKLHEHSMSQKDFIAQYSTEVKRNRTHDLRSSGSQIIFRFEYYPCTVLIPSLTLRSTSLRSWWAWQATTCVSVDKWTLVNDPSLNRHRQGDWRLLKIVFIGSAASIFLHLNYFPWFGEIWMKKSCCYFLIKSQLAGFHACWTERCLRLRFCDLLAFRFCCWAQCKWAHCCYSVQQRSYFIQTVTSCALCEFKKKF